MVGPASANTWRPYVWGDGDAVRPEDVDWRKEGAAVMPHRRLVDSNQSEIFQMNLDCQLPTPLIFLLHLFLECILSGQAQTLHAVHDTVPPSLPEMTPLSCSISLHHKARYPISNLVLYTWASYTSWSLVEGYRNENDCTVAWENIFFSSYLSTIIVQPNITTIIVTAIYHFAPQSIILSSNKIQNSGILVPTYPGCPGKWL